ncbi:MAG: hypothetical protein ABJK83_00175 [Parasphingorhabdus sp.]|uniref:hypothetical protein n=1 Tax=Parasphingorhabdus sp. TaxID=2709688 RepID=UPI00329A1ABD
MAALSDRFREIALQCRELFHDLVEAWWRSSLHQHQAALSARQSLVQIAANDCIEPKVTDAAVRTFWQKGRFADFRCGGVLSGSIFAKQPFDTLFVRNLMATAWVALTAPVRASAMVTFAVIWL